MLTPGTVPRPPITFRLVVPASQCGSLIGTIIILNWSWPYSAIIDYGLVRMDCAVQNWFANSQGLAVQYNVYGTMDGQGWALTVPLFNGVSWTVLYSTIQHLKAGWLICYASILSLILYSFFKINFSLYIFLSGKGGSKIKEIREITGASVQVKTIKSLLKNTFIFKSVYLCKKCRRP